MSKEEERKMPRSHADLAATIRRDWKGIKPATRVFRDKSKYTRKIKHR